MKRSLTEIGTEHRTDKSIDHFFTDFYDEHLSPKRDDNLNVLEIGIHLGRSLRTWKEYFSNGIIYGLDINDLKNFEEERILIEQADQTDVVRLSNVFPNVEFDIIVDDGGHTMLQQQITLVSIFNRLKSGGFYILEDLHTSMPYYVRTFSEDLTKRTTLSMIEKFCNNDMDFSNYFVDAVKITEVFKQIEFCKILSNNDGMSITSIFKKK